MTAIHDQSDRPRILHRSNRAPRVTAWAAVWACFIAPALAQTEPDPAPESEPAATQTEPEQAPAATEPEVAPEAPIDTTAEISRRLRDPESAESALAALANAEQLPLPLWRDISVLTAADRPASIRVPATEAVSRFGTRESVKLLVQLAQDPDHEVRRTALAALPRLTGLGENWAPDRWAQWAADTATWNDRAWNRTLITAQARQRQNLDQQAQNLRDEVVALHRRLHVELDAAGRSSLITELIRDERPWLRSLGFELAGRDLSARTALGPEVARAAAERLGHPDATTRAKAANLVSRLVPPDAMLLLTDALKAEDDPRAAEPMLLGVARWPNDQAVAPTLRWLSREDAPIDAATMALWTLVNSGHVTDPTSRERALAAIRALGPDRIGEAGMRVLVRLGTDEDLDRVIEIVSDPDAPGRNAAAEALCESPAGTERLIAIASGDPRLFLPASRGITRHLRTPEGLRLLAGLPALSIEDRERAVLAAAEFITPPELGKAAQSAELGDSLTIRVLTRLTEPGLVISPEVAQGLVILARARLRLGEPDLARDAMVLLDGLTLPATTAEAARRTRLWIHLVTGEQALARELPGATVGDWLFVFDQIPAESPAKRSAADLILERFASDLEPADRERVIAFRTPPPPPPPAAAEPELAETPAADPASGDAPAETPPG